MSPKLPQSSRLINLKPSHRLLRPNQSSETRQLPRVGFSDCRGDAVRSSRRAWTFWLRSHLDSTSCLLRVSPTTIPRRVLWSTNSILRDRLCPPGLPFVAVAVFSEAVSAHYDNYGGCPGAHTKPQYDQRFDVKEQLQQADCRPTGAASRYNEFRPSSPIVMAV